MSPFEHGSFVLDDGGGKNLDLGNYERFLDINLQSENNLTTGKYILIVEAEHGDGYLGKIWSSHTSYHRRSSRLD